MYTLALLSLIYSIWGFRKFKKIYGHYDIFKQEPKGWTFGIALTTAYFFIVSLILIIIYLP